MDFNQKIQEFQNKNILLLQGPVGPFFYKLSKRLQKEKAKIFKLNFNGGDKIFYPFNADVYRQNFKHFRYFFTRYCQENRIDYIIAYNDCRPLHTLAIKLAKRLKIGIYIFEEGYLRPNFITFEKDGVNANSKMPKNKEFYLNLKLNSLPENDIKGSFSIMAFYAFWYWLFAFLLAMFYNNKLHHRSLNPLECIFWLKSLYRKYFYQISEKKIKQSLESTLKHKYFVAILQVHNDTQITKHYKGKNIEHFIKNALNSFAKNAANNHYLVFKHHPMDRGYKNYGLLIENLSKQHNIQNRVFYTHDNHLPTLLNNALGCVVINSTVGFSALYHHCPVKICGDAFYDIEELSYQKPLDLFWKEAQKNKPNQSLCLNLRNYLIHTNQINGNFYKSDFLN